MWRGVKGRREKPHQCFVETPEAETINELNATFFFNASSSKLAIIRTFEGNQ